MKKIIIFFLIVIIIIAGISYIYLNYKINYNEAKRENLEFESYKDKQIKGIELTTIINKAIDNNESNKIQKDNKGKYINNENNSINIDLKMLDYDKTYNMEMFFNGGMDKFVQAYGEILFECKKIEYHKTTRKNKIYVV